MIKYFKLNLLPKTNDDYSRGSELSNWCHRSSQLGGWACRCQHPCSRSSRDTKSIKNYKEGENFFWKKNKEKKTFISYDKRLTKAAKRISLVDFFLKYICEIDMLQSAKNWVKLYNYFFKAQYTKRDSLFLM